MRLVGTGACSCGLSLVLPHISVCAAPPPHFIFATAAFLLPRVLYLTPFCFPLHPPRSHRIIASTFSIQNLPRATWQIDPFGHSASQASVLSSPIGGFSSLFFGRIDYQDRALRENTSSLEMIWRASPSLGASAQVFTDAMPGYGPPDGRLCWDDVACANNQPIQDDPLLEQYNVDFFVNLSVTIAQTQAAQYRADADGTLHLMWPMGSDFQHVNSFSWFKNLDKLLHHVNAAQTAVNLLYSTPAQYADAKFAQSATAWPLKTDDFMPYADVSRIGEGMQAFAAAACPRAMRRLPCACPFDVCPCVPLSMHAPCCPRAACCPPAPLPLVSP